MSGHKTGFSNWTAEDKKLYRERRNKGLRGQLGFVTVHQVVKGKKGRETRVPLGNKIGQSFFSPSRCRQAAKVQRQGVVKQERMGINTIAA